MSRRRYMPHQLLVPPVRGAIDVGLFVSSSFSFASSFLLSSLLTPSTLLCSLPQLIHRSPFSPSPKRPPPPPANWTKLRGCPRPLDPVVGSEGSGAASPAISTSSAGGGVASSFVSNQGLPR